MSNSGNVLKSSFIKFTNTNTRVIDPNALVAKRLEGFSGVLREQEPEAPVYDEEGNLVLNATLDMLTGDAEYIPAENGEFSPINFGEGSIDNQVPEPEAKETVAVEAILEQARADAESIIAQAQEQAEGIRAVAKSEGYAAGKEEAMALLEAEKRSLDEERIALHNQYEGMIREIEPQMVEVITDVYRKVFSDNFYSRREIMVCLINKALMGLTQSEQVVIYVSPSDYDLIASSKYLLMEKTALQTEPEIVQRDDFLRGQAKIETTFGIVDCSIDTELEELSKALKVLSYESRGM